MKRKLNEHDVPEAVSTSFVDLGLDDRLLQSVAGHKFSKPTPVQSRTIRLIKQGKNVAVCSKTGTGKTLAYLLPLVDSILRSRTTTPAAASASSSALILVPSKELASQTAAVLKGLTKHFAKLISAVNLSRQEDDGVTRARLREKPDFIIATPGRFSHFLDSESNVAKSLRFLVVDEADLVVPYGHEKDLEHIAAVVPASVQAVFVSATLRADDHILNKLFCKASQPEVVDLTQEETGDATRLAQYIVPTAEDEKFLLLYAIFKLQLIKGKIIVFVADVDRCYRLKLFLEQFGVRSCVLNSELPVNSRLHVVEEFNKGVYDTLIAADDNEVVGEGAKSQKKRMVKEAEATDGADGESDVQVDQASNEEMEQEDSDEGGIRISKASRNQKAVRTSKHEDTEYGVARGIDFRRVTCVLNFDLPLSSKSYTHRIGRTARAGQKGMALSFYVPKELYRKHKPTSIPQCINDEKVLERITRQQGEKGATIQQWQFDVDKLAGFRYRLADALRSVTRIAIREARTRELRQELINSAKLQRHFEEHPEDLRHLRHDTESHSVRQQAHLKHVPDYLLPNGGKAALKQDVGFVGLKSNNENRLRRARAMNKSRRTGRSARSKGSDPLKSLNARGRGKK